MSAPQPKVAITDSYVRSKPDRRRHHRVVLKLSGRFLHDGADHTFITKDVSCGGAHVEAVAIIENIIEHVAETLKKDPLDVRKANLSKTAGPLQPGENVFSTSILPLLEEKAMLYERKAAVLEFNKVIHFCLLYS